MSKAAIKINNACLGYKNNNQNIEILKNIHLECLSGDLIGVAGINGSGKSTLLRSVCGLMPVLSGEILLNQKSIDQYSKNELAKIISIVLTEKISGFNLNCFDTVAAGQMPYTDLFNKLSTEHLEVINKAIAVCGLNDHQEKLLSELSDGLYQKTMIARAIAQQTPIMLLDEPTAFLDYASKHELFLLLKKLCVQENKCIVVSSHDLELMMKYCKKILLVKDHQVELIETSEVNSHPVFKELSGGYL